jgi:hypothetical protein
MNVRITQLDGKLPNLALMKLSAWHKAKGDVVHFTRGIAREIFEPDYDIVYASAIFKWSQNCVSDMKREWPNSIIGGTGTSSKVTTEEIVGDFTGCDYEIYPWFKPSIGFTQRGCRLNCSFCVVPQKEGKVKEVTTINEIWRGDGHPRQIHLLDNDFFGQPRWRERCEEIIEGNFAVCLNQGINVRLIHKDGANMLAKTRYSDDQFKRRRIYTAWDNRRDEDIFLRGIGLLLDAGIKPQAIMVYMLCGYWPGETMDDVMYRFEKMKAIGLLPYPMVYDNKNTTLKKFQRWVIRRFHEFIPFDEYLRGEIHARIDEPMLLNVEPLPQTGNCNHAYRNGRTKPWAFATMWRGKPRISEETKTKIINQRDSGIPIAAVAASLGVSKTRVSVIHRQAKGKEARK